LNFVKKVKEISSKTDKQTPQNPPIPFSDCIAKTYNNNGQILPGRNVFDHAQIVGRVAEELVNRFPEHLKPFFPKQAGFISALHDIGKISPTFQLRLFSAINQKTKDIEDKLQQLDFCKGYNEKDWGGHAGLGRHFLRDKFNVSVLADVVGMHHGGIKKTWEPPSKTGGEPWNIERNGFLCALEEKFNTKISECECAEFQKSIMAGLTTVADWIGSGDFFKDPNILVSDSLIKQAVDLAGFIQPKPIKNLSFENIFSFNPKDIQKTFYEKVTDPGLYVLEAPMGLGKTEAALYGAYKRITSEKNPATGIYFALPTQLTSNMIHERVQSFLKIIQPNQTPTLIHSNDWAWLAQNLLMGEEGAPGGSWFSGKKRILSPYAVGTIDQAILSVMNVKYYFVRLFGLIGKVIILDEVHSYDMYTGTIMEELVNALLKLNCTVIILSATLTSKRKEALFNTTENLNDNYPSISWKKQEEDKPSEFNVISPNVDNVIVEYSNNDHKQIKEAISCAKNGQQVLWIENTVRKAQEIYGHISAFVREDGIETGLLHSRFTALDRYKKEKFWVNTLGKSGAKKRNEHGRILVGTQVLEQSLDIDADFLVTRLCPIDFFFQRIGRLWRHKIFLRPQGAVRKVCLLSPTKEDFKKGYGKAFGPSSLVYSSYILYRTLETLGFGNIKNISLPNDIRSMIELTYIEKQENKKLLELKKQDEKKESNLKIKANYTLSEGNLLSDENVSARYITQPTTDVLLVGKWVRSKTKNEFFPIPGSEYDPIIIEKDKDQQKFRSSVAALRGWYLPVPDYCVPSTTQITAFERGIFGKYTKDICIGEVQKNGRINLPDGRSTNGLYYTFERGYESVES